MWRSGVAPRQKIAFLKLIRCLWSLVDKEAREIIAANLRLAVEFAGNGDGWDYVEYGWLRTVMRTLEIYSNSRVYNRSVENT